MSLYYHWAEESDLNEVQEFLRAAFGPGSTQALPGRLEWLTRERPEKGRISCCRDDDGLVAVRLCLPVEIGLGSRRIGAAFGIDMIVREDYRRRGVGGRLVEMSVEEFDASLSTGQSSDMGQLYRHLSAGRAGSFGRAVRVSRPAFDVRPDRLVKQLAAYINGRLRRDRSARRRQVSMEHAASLAGTVCEKQLPEEAAIENSFEILRWRYGARCYPDYTLHELTSDHCEPGLMVSRVQGDEEVLVDLLSRPADLSRLLRAAAVTSSARRMTAIHCGERLGRAFQSAGFVLRPHDAELIALTADRALQTRLTRAGWAIFAGQSDIDLMRRPGLEQE